MGARRGDSFTLKVGVARDGNKVPSPEEFEEGRKIAARLDQRGRKRVSIGKSKRARVSDEAKKPVKIDLDSIFKKIFPGG